MTATHPPSIAPIVAEHEAAQDAARSAVLHAIRCGELLIEAKDSMPHGQFGSFCRQLPFAERTARAYMQLARLDEEKRQRVADSMSLRAALRYCSAGADSPVYELVFELIALADALSEMRAAAQMLAPPDDEAYGSIVERLRAAEASSKQILAGCSDQFAVRALADAARRVEEAAILHSIDAFRAVGRLLNGEPLAAGAA